MKSTKTLFGLFLLTLLLLGSATAKAAPVPVRLNGAFFQFQTEMLTDWTPATWGNILGQMKQLKMDTVIIQYMAGDASGGGTFSFVGPAGKEDATDAILNYADTNGFKVFLGLYSSALNGNPAMTASNYLAQELTANTNLALQVWNRYLATNHHASFAGWYVPLEPWTANYSPTEITNLRAFYKGVHDGCVRLSGNVPVAMSPFINGQRATPCQVQQVYSQLLANGGIDILMLQDSVGAQGWTNNLTARVGPYFQAFENACAAAGVQLWANAESFNSQYLPCDAARLAKQITADSPYVQQLVTFEFLNYLNPVAFLPEWTTARTNAMKQLFSAYEAQFAATNYYPAAPPVVAGNFSGGTVALTWNGATNDQYQVRYKTNLSDTAWATLGQTVSANGAAFSVTDAGANQQSRRFYQVQRLARLQVPENMVWIPPGTFTMGTPAGDTNKTAGELSPFQVTLTSGFWIGQFELTQSEYQNVICTNPAAFTGNLDFPVETVSWNDAMQYCAALTEQESQAGRLPSNYVYRLPTEAEWEYAARAGTTTWFFFGDSAAVIASYGWENTDSSSTTHAVGQLQSNPWGLCDTGGNVFEWCWDLIAAAPSGPVTDFIGTTNGAYHAIRGGGYDFSPQDCRSSWRLAYAATNRFSDLGFRIMLAPSP